MNCVGDVGVALSGKGARLQEGGGELRSRQVCLRAVCFDADPFPTGEGADEGAGVKRGEDHYIEGRSQRGVLKEQPRSKPREFREHTPECSGSVGSMCIVTDGESKRCSHDCDDGCWNGRRDRELNEPSEHSVGSA